jgi:hypothetical protein
MTEDQFIKAVEDVIPNPPFKISIESHSHKKIRDQHSFKETSALALKDRSWDQNDNVKVFDFEFIDADRGFVGSAAVAILESHGFPVPSIEMMSKSVEIDEQVFELQKKLALDRKEIGITTTSITIGEDGGIEQSSSSHRIFSSRSKLSLHGIEIPSSLFPDSWTMQRNQVKLDWPIPALLVVDVCGKMDLDLNSSRTQIIMSDKWSEFEDALSFEVCQALASSVTADYWYKLKEVLGSTSKNETFLSAMNRVKPPATAA